MRGRGSIEARMPWCAAWLLVACSAVERSEGAAPASSDVGASGVAGAPVAPGSSGAGGSVGKTDAGIECVPGGLMTDEFSIPACPDAGASVGPGDPDGATTTPLNGQCGDVPVKLCATNLSSGPLPATIEWSKPSFGDAHDEVTMQPIVAPLVDGTPHIVLIGSGENNDVYLYGIRGDGSAMSLNRRVTGLSMYSALAAGDIDADGLVEFVAATSNFGLMALSDTGQQQWRRDDLGAYLDSSEAPAIADMDGDGVPEISCGRVVLNADGTIRMGVPPDNLGAQSASVPADVDGDGKLELVLGVGVYRLDGTALWSDPTSRGGFIALGNFDSDAAPELVVVGDGTIRLLDAESGAVHWSTPYVLASGNSYAGGPPVVADFDGDGEAEIGTASASAYTVFDGDGTELWKVPTTDNSNFTGSIAFDFDADGSAEVVQTDTAHVRILSGIDGAVRFEGPRESATSRESATIADLDADGHAELVVPFDYFGSSRHGIDVYGDPSWAPAQPTWNQYDYTITNIDPDGSVPSAVARPWLEHNTYRAAGPPANAAREPCGCVGDSSP